MEPKDRKGMPPLDLEDDGYYADNENFTIDDLYPEDDPEMDYYDSLDDDLDLNPHWDMPFDDDEDDLDNYDEDIFDDLY